jgi:hypothetical protein
MGKDLRAIRERVDDTNVRVSNVREEIEALRNSIPSRRRSARHPPYPLAIRMRLRAGAGPTGAPPSTGRLSPTRMVRHGTRGLRGGASGRSPSTGFDAFSEDLPAIGDGRRCAVPDRRDPITHKTSGPTPLAAYNAVIQNYPMATPYPTRTTSAGWRRNASVSSTTRASRGTPSFAPLPIATPVGWRDRISIGWHGVRHSDLSRHAAPLM